MDKYWLRSMVMLLPLAMYTSSHTLHMGRTCPNVEAIPNLSIDKVLGVWYVAYKFDTDNTCVMWNLTKSTTTHDRYFVSESRQLALLDVIGVSHKQEVIGTLTVPNPEIPSRMRVAWPTLSSALTGSADFIIFDTDYKTYLAVFECDRAGFLHRRSVTILARKLTIDDMFIRRVRRLLDNVDVSHGSLDKIDHNLCRAKGYYNWNLGSKQEKGESLREQLAHGIDAYDISQIEIIGDGISESSGSFRGSLQNKPAI